MNPKDIGWEGVKSIITKNKIYVSSWTFKLYYKVNIHTISFQKPVTLWSPLKTHKRRLWTKKWFFEC
jgi:hypothetical protein